MPHKTNSAFAGFHLSAFNKFIVSSLGVSIAGLYLAAGTSLIGDAVRTDDRHAATTTDFQVDPAALSGPASVVVAA